MSRILVTPAALDGGNKSDRGLNSQYPARAREGSCVENCFSVNPHIALNQGAIDLD